MQDFKVGDRVIHKLSGQKMTIKRINGSVASLIKDIPKPWMFWGLEQKGDIAVCLLENLEHEEKTTRG